MNRTCFGAFALGFPLEAPTHAGDLLGDACGDRNGDHAHRLLSRCSSRGDPDQCTSMVLPWVILTGTTTCIGGFRWRGFRI